MRQSWRWSPAAALVLVLTGAAGADPLPPPTLEFAFAELVTLAPGITPGQTPYGGRNIAPITGGTFEGPGIHGTILPGGWDWQLRRADGCISIKADYMLRTDERDRPIAGRDRCVQRDRSPAPASWSI